MSGLLIVFFVMQGLFPHIDVKAAEYRQKKISLTLSEIMKKTPDHPDVQLIAQILDLLPREHYKNLLKLDYDPQYNNLPRGMAKKDHLILNSFSIDDDQELVSVLIHEIGHVTDLGFLVDKSRFPRPSEFDYGSFKVSHFDPSRQFYRLTWQDAYTIHPQKKRDDFVSTYSMTNPFEDFAESYNFFVLHKKNFIEKSQTNKTIAKKFEFLHRRVFFGQTYDFYSAEHYPRLIADTTLLPFDLTKLVAYIEDRDDRRRLFGRTKLRRTARRTRTITEA